MTFDDFKILAKTLRSVYYNSGLLADNDAVQVWYQLLKDIPYEDAALSVARYASTEHFPPTPVDIRRGCITNTKATPTANEAWALVRKALRNAIYGSEEEFAKLPMICQRALGSADILKTLAMMDSETVNSFEQSHFIKTYNILVEREKKDAQLPESIRQMIEANRQSTTEPPIGAKESESLPENTPTASVDRIDGYMAQVRAKIGRVTD